MRRLDFIVGYDVASPKRLQKLARLLEKVAIRIQYSLFLYTDVSKEDVTKLVNEVLAIIDEKEDDVRIYQIDTSRSLHLMNGADLRYPKIFY